MQQREKEISIERFDLNSSVGSLEGGGSLSLNEEQKISSGDLEALISLTEEGHQSFGGFIALRANQPVDTPNRNWIVRIGLSNNKVTSVSIQPGG